MVGTVVEWYEFFLYATAASLVFGKFFFPNAEHRAGRHHRGVPDLRRGLHRPAARRHRLRPDRRQVRPQAHAAGHHHPGRRRHLPDGLPARASTPSATGRRRCWWSCASSRASPSAASGAAPCCWSPSTARTSPAASGPAGRRPPFRWATCWPPWCCWACRWILRPTSSSAGAGAWPSGSRPSSSSIGYYIRTHVSDAPIFLEAQAAGGSDKAASYGVARGRQAATPSGIFSAMGLRFAENILYYIVVTLLDRLPEDRRGERHQPAAAGLLMAHVIHFLVIPQVGRLSDALRPQAGLPRRCRARGHLGVLRLPDVRHPRTRVIIVAGRHASACASTRLMYAGQPAIMAEMFPTRMRYSGVSLGYQVTSIVAGSLAPIIADGPAAGLRLLGAGGHLRGGRLRHHRRRGADAAGNQGRLAARHRRRRRPQARAEPPGSAADPPAARRATMLQQGTVMTIRNPTVPADSPVNRWPGRRALVTGGASGIGAGRGARAGRPRRPRRRRGPGPGRRRGAGRGGRRHQPGRSTCWTRGAADDAGSAGRWTSWSTTPGSSTSARSRTSTRRSSAASSTLMLEAPFLLIRAALPQMYAQGFGRIINVSSRARAARLAVQVGLRHGQARARGAVQGDRARGRRARGDQQLRQPRLRAHAAGREADRRPGRGPRHPRGRGAGARSC